MHAVCLWAPLSQTRRRGVPRAIREGKRWKPDDYDASMRGTAELARRWHVGCVEEPATYASLFLWDNTVWPSR